MEKEFLKIHLLRYWYLTCFGTSVWMFFQVYPRILELQEREATWEIQTMKLMLWLALSVVSGGLLMFTFGQPDSRTRRSAVFGFGMAIALVPIMEFVHLPFIPWAIHKAIFSPVFYLMLFGGSPGPLVSPEAQAPVVVNAMIRFFWYSSVFWVSFSFLAERIVDVVFHVESVQSVPSPLSPGESGPKKDE